MQSLARFIMAGPWQAMTVVAAGAVLALTAPPLSAPLGYLGGGALALVTLRLGAVRGAQVMAGAAVAVALLGGALVGRPLVAVLATVVLWLPVWGLAEYLRRRADLDRALSWATGLGVALVLAVYGAYGDPVAVWERALTPLAEALVAGQGLETTPAELAGAAASVMTGLAAAGLVLGAMICLLLGRWWQAQLYNPGGFRREFHGLRLNRAVGWGTLGLALASQVAMGAPAALAGQLVLVCLVPCALAGLALAHGVVGLMGMKGAWLAVLYALILLQPMALLLMAVLGLADTWLDIRRRLGAA